MRRMRTTAPARFTLGVAVVLAGLVAATPTQVAAQIDPFIGQIMTVGFNFCPRGWAPAEGQLLRIDQNAALFALLGTTYGGDGRTTFALPDLRGRVPVAPDGSTILLGEAGGQAEVTLGPNQLPSHSHTAATEVTLHASSAAADSGNPDGRVLAQPETETDPGRGRGGPPPGRGPGGGAAATVIYNDGPANVDMAPEAATADVTIGSAGNSSASIGVRDPFLGLTFCIALQGIFPSRN